MREDSKQETRQMADLIRRYVDGRVGPYDWDDFMGITFSDPFLERASLQCDQILEASSSGLMSQELADAEMLRIAERLDSFQVK